MQETLSLGPPNPYAGEDCEIRADEEEDARIEPAVSQIVIVHHLPKEPDQGTDNAQQHRPAGHAVEHFDFAELFLGQWMLLFMISCG